MSLKIGDYWIFCECLRIIFFMAETFNFLKNINSLPCPFSRSGRFANIVVSSREYLQEFSQKLQQQIQ